MAGEPAGHRMDISNGVSRVFFTTISGPRADTSTAEMSAEQEQPLRLQTSVQHNRERVGENSRIVATHMVTASVPMVLLSIAVIILIIVVHVSLYIQGWWVLLGVWSKPCDQPLKWWLVVMQMLPLVRYKLSKVEMDPWKKGMLEKCYQCGCIAVGAIMYRYCRTCGDTNPELVWFTKVYLIYQVVQCAFGAFVSCGLIYVVFWMHRRGLLRSAPGPHRAAREGLINDIETVRFHPGLFSENGAGELEPPECPVCYQEFVEDEPIKRTPCKHFFHEPCLGKWLQNAKSCPLCREDLEEALDNPQQQESALP